MVKPIKAILIGAGQRGLDAYGPYALEHPDQLKFIAVAEPDAERRTRFSAQHNIPAEYQLYRLLRCHHKLSTQNLHRSVHRLIVIVHAGTFHH